MDDIVDYIELIVKESGDKLEGNCYYSHNTLKKNKKYETKQKNLIWCGSQIKNKVCEIGFNAGHSAMLLLFNNNKDIDFTVFDIGRHKYTLPCLKYLAKCFNETRFEYIEGNSIKTIPAYIKNNEVGCFDVVHIDGGHSKKCIENDLKNADILVKEGGIIVIDDTGISVINNCVEEYLSKGYSEVFDITKTCHRVIKKEETKKMKIHQIFLDIGLKPLSEREDWLKHIEINKKLNPNCEYILWDDEKVNNLIAEYPAYEAIISTFPHKFYLIDFIRYLILWKHGGIYIDLDVCCKQSIEGYDNILGCSFGYNKKGYYEKVNNSVIKLKDKDSCKSLLDFCVSEYMRINDKDMYKNMVARRFFNSVGAYMFGNWCKNNKLVSDIKFKDFFWDEESKSWSSNQIIKKDIDPNRIKYGSVNYVEKISNV